MKDQLRVIKATLKGFNIPLVGVSKNDGGAIFEDIKIENFSEMKIQFPISKINFRGWLYSVVSTSALHAQGPGFTP